MSNFRKVTKKKLAFAFCNGNIGVKDGCEFVAVTESKHSRVGDSNIVVIPAEWTCLGRGLRRPPAPPNEPW